MSGQLLSVILFPVLGLLRRTRLTAECGPPLGHRSSEVCLDSEERTRAEQSREQTTKSRADPRWEQPGGKLGPPGWSPPPCPWWPGWPLVACLRLGQGKPPRLSKKCSALGVEVCSAEWCCKRFGVRFL